MCHLSKELALIQITSWLDSNNIPWEITRREGTYIVLDVPKLTTLLDIYEDQHVDIWDYTFNDLYEFGYTVDAVLSLFSDELACMKEMPCED